MDNPLKQGILGDNLHPLINTWPHVQTTLKLSGFNVIYLVERAFLDEACTLYLNDDLSGLWYAVADDEKANALLFELGTSDYAHAWANGKMDSARGWDNWRVTSSDFEKICAYAETIAVRGVTSARPDNAGAYPAELRAAIEAFKAVHGDPAVTAKRSPKAALTAWLEANKPDLSANARERIATVANWQPTGGAPKTPGE